MLWTVVAPVLRAQVLACALESAVAAATVPAFETALHWDDQQRAFVHPQRQAQILLRMTSVRKVGNDVYIDDTDGATFIRTWQGMRECVLNVQVRSWNHNYATWALEYCERIVTRLENRQSVKDALAAVNTCVVDANEVLNIPNVKIDDRIVSVANADIRFRSGFVDTDGAESLDYFNQILWSSHWKQPDGVELDAAAQSADLAIPPGA
jgi:hypothetical protein